MDKYNGLIPKKLILNLSVVLGLIAFLNWSNIAGSEISPSDASFQKSPEYNAPFSNGRLSLGVTYLGGGVRVGFINGWGIEGRYVTGQEGSADGTVKAQFLSARVIKHLINGRRWAPYGAFEGGLASASDSHRKASGTAFGLVGGIEFSLTKNVSITLEMGPYYIALKDKVGGGASPGTDIVIGSTLYWHLF